MKLSANQLKLLCRIKRGGGQDVYFRDGAWRVGRSGNQERTYASLAKKGLIAIERTLRITVAVTSLGEQSLGIGTAA